MTSPAMVFFFFHSTKPETRIFSEKVNPKRQRDFDNSKKIYINQLT